MDNQEVLDEFQSENRLHNFEGESGIKNLNTIFGTIGYKQEPFLHGSPLELFLQDNSGCIEVMLEWLSKNMTPEWKHELTFEDTEK